MASTVRIPGQDKITQMVAPALTLQSASTVKRESHDLSAQAAPPSKPATKTKSRKRVNTAEKRASHNAVERQRREMLNGRFLVSRRERQAEPSTRHLRTGSLSTIRDFQDLARLLPSLAKIRRPSKSAIVNGSIDHLSLQRTHRLSAARELRRMFAEKQDMLTELNEWRSRNGMSPRETTGWTRDLEELLSVESEIFGEFTGMGNGDGDGEGEGDGDADIEAEHQEYNANQSIEVPEIEPPMAALRSGSFADVISIDGSALRRDSLHRSADTYASSSLQSSLMGAESFGQPRFTMPSRQKSFAPTELSSVLSGSPPQLTQAFGNGSPIDSTQHLALQAFLSGGDAFARGPSLESPGGLSGDCITPPSHDVHIDVNTFAPPSPPTAATSFAHANADQDKVSQWAAQQVMLQYVQEGQHLGNGRSGKNASSMDVEFTNPFPTYNPASRLDAAHQALLTHQPQLAAAAFPPPYADTLFGSSGGHSNESSSTHGDRFGPTAASLASNSQLHHFFAANSAAMASLNPSLDGMTYSQIEQWSRFGQITSRSPLQQGGGGGQPENLDEFRQAIRAGINMGMAAGMVRSS
jgi:hypothetical protein